MSEATRTLAARRLELQRRVASERQDVRLHLLGIRGAFGGLAGRLSPARLLEASPLFVAAGVTLTLVLGRGRVLRTLGAGVALVGLFRRYRSTFRLAGEFVRQMADDQAVRRSR